jgi:hypothetical protein
MSLLQSQENEGAQAKFFPPDPLPDNFSYDISIDNSDKGKRLKFVVETPSNAWFGITYGNGMINTDIVRFAAKPDEPFVEDMYTSLFYPYNDKEYEAPEDYEDT